MNKELLKKLLQFKNIYGYQHNSNEFTADLSKELEEITKELFYIVWEMDFKELKND